MYIVNPEKIGNKVAYKGFVAKYILDHNIPILSKQGNIYYFSNTDVLKEVLFYAPDWIKLLIKLGL